VLAAALVLAAACLPAAPALAAADVPPVILGVTPDKTMAAGWTGDTVTVTTRAAVKDGQLDPLDAAKCTLSLNGKPSGSGAPTDTPTAGGSFMSFTFPTVTTDEVTFKVTLVTEGGQTTSREWTYTVGEKKQPGLINFQIIKQWWVYIAKGAWITVYLTLISMAIACVLALLGALGRLSRKMSYRQAWNKHHSYAYMVGHTFRMIPYWLATFYTSLFRGTPLLLQIYVIYAAIPTFINYGRARWGFFNSVPYPSAIVSGIAALSLNYGAYLTEVFRAGIQSVPRGQSEAAWAIGMTPLQTQRRIVLPQAFKIVIPAIGNDFIALIKDTSLVSTIGVIEVLKRAQLVGGRYYDFLTPLLVAAMIYWALTIFFSFWQAKLERRMERDRARER
jgi:polar amino acid transport system permease protein